VASPISFRWAVFFTRVLFLADLGQPAGAALNRNIAIRRICAVVVTLWSLPYRSPRFGLFDPFFFPLFVRRGKDWRCRSLCFPLRGIQGCLFPSWVGRFYLFTLPYESLLVSRACPFAHCLSLRTASGSRVDEFVWAFFFLAPFLWCLWSPEYYVECLANRRSPFPDCSRLDCALFFSCSGTKGVCFEGVSVTTCLLYRYLRRRRYLSGCPFPQKDPH